MEIEKSGTLCKCRFNGQAHYAINVGLMVNHINAYADLMSMHIRKIHVWWSNTLVVMQIWWAKILDISMFVGQAHNANVGLMVRHIMHMEI